MGCWYPLCETLSGDATIKQLVLPRSLRSEALQQLHSTPTAGHLGDVKTLGRIQERFYWVQCRHCVQEWCCNCELCAQIRGPPNKQIKAPLRKYNVRFPMECIAIDVQKPQPSAEAGNKHILVVSDYFTKWVEA